MEARSTERLMCNQRAAATLGRMHESAPDAFLSALSARDFGRFAESLAPEAQARMLLPRGPEVHAGREEIARRFEGWFSRASDFEVLDTHRAKVGRRNRLSWRLRMRRDGQSREVIEQVAFVTTGPDGIAEIDLLCSGFLPDEVGDARSIMGAPSALLRGRT
jgi:SnoaL-like domain